MNPTEIVQLHVKSTLDSRFSPVVVLRICSSLCDINCNRQSIFLH
jgi:hypothetical protein